MERYLGKDKRGRLELGKKGLIYNGGSERRRESLSKKSKAEKNRTLVLVRWEKMRQSSDTGFIPFYL